MTKEELIAIIKNIPDYKIFENELNIVAVRNSFVLDNKFSDDLYVWSDKVEFRKYTITTKPGKYWWERFFNSKGVAILAENFYLDTWILGLHRNQYKALVQVKPVIVYRDSNRNTNVDMTITEKGIFGINIHRAHKNFLVRTVEKYSAGCQVFQDIKQYNEFIEICEKSNQKYFSYALINQKIIDKFKQK